MRRENKALRSDDAGVVTDVLEAVGNENGKMSLLLARFLDAACSEWTFACCLSFHFIELLLLLLLVLLEGNILFVELLQRKKKITRLGKQKNL